MDIKEVLDTWKTVILFIVFIIGSTVSFFVWASDQLEQQKLVIEAKSALIHDQFYQESRIARKEDQITENTRELASLLRYIGDDEPTPRQERQIDYLDSEISRLRKEIEEIRVLTLE